LSFFWFFLIFCHFNMFKFIFTVSIVFFLTFLNKLFMICVSYNYYINNILFNLITINISINYIFIWFIFFMYLIIYLILFFLSRRIYSYSKFIYIWIMILLITNSVSLLSLIEDFATFIILFESLFFPVCFISLFYSFSNRFIFAIYCLIIFSSLSSVLCILIFFILVSHIGIIDLNIFIEFCFLDSPYLNITILTLLIILFFIKYPVWPFHIWLPEVHVEVTTEISIILAAIVLKMGFFGLYRFVIMALIQFTNWWIGLIDVFILWGILILSISILFLSDYKKLIAHWSILHTGIGLILVWHQDFIFIGIVILCNLAHILSSSFMFYLIGHMYDNHGLRVFLLLITFFGVSIWGSFFIGVVLFNIDFPFMLLFYVELLICLGFAMFSSLYLILFALVGIIMFCTSIYLYLTLNYFSFSWVNKNIKLDLSINDIFIIYLFSIIILKFFFIIMNIL